MAGRAVAKVADDCHVAIGVPSTDEAVAFHGHGVAGGVQRLRTDDFGVEMKTALLGVPATKINSAEQGQQVHRVDAEAPGHTVFSIGRKDKVLLAECASGTDLCRFLAEARSPET